ncbi:PqqD family protein [Chloroflexota bacterium]
MNETGKTIWIKLNCIFSLHQMADELTEEYAASTNEIGEAVKGLVNKLVNSKMVVEYEPSNE